MTAQPPGGDELHDVIAHARADSERRHRSFRARALELFPPVCAHCGREFTGIRIRELTVHHKDHNHDHNPPDGSNWELLCLHCHENEHSRQDVANAYDATSGAQAPAASTFRPFADLETLLKKPR
jgi:hypothetical protein